MPRWSKQGFTIIELLVALGISAVMIFLIGKFFSEVSGAIRLGINKGEIAAKNNTVSEELYRDFKSSNMVGPVEGGFMVLVHASIPNAPMKHRTTPGGETRRHVISDQLLFIRKVGPSAGDPLEPLVAAGPNSYANSVGNNVEHARVWYGHLRRTRPDGSDTDVLGGSADSELNKWANQWILGRQVLFLDSAASGTTHTTVDPAMNLNAAEFNAPVVGGLAGSAPANLRFLFKSTADIADTDLLALTAPGPGSYLDDTLSMDEYRQRAYMLTYGIERLRVNTEISSRFESWRVAQAHPFLMDNVSDFTIEFAADINPHDGEVDFITVDGEKEIKWYGYWFNRIGKGQRSLRNPQGNLASHNPYEPEVYPIPQNADYPPFDEFPNSRNSVRLPYQFDDFPFGFAAAFVWRPDPPHDDYWPYLLRFRYRVHDDQGIIGDINDEPGIWFEQIVAVNRQP